ncbi:hypothetical protein K2Y11_12750 [bacterium]|nr:hypothetical protein [bacterium]
MAWDDVFKNALLTEAQKRGIDPVDLGTAISYETGGTADAWQRGPTTQWGQHRGLIQWGEPQRAKYGITADTSVPDQMDAVGRYLTDRGVKPGMGLLDIYSAINAGSVGRYNASDAANGGAPGTVADKVNNQMKAHRAKVLAFLGQGGANAADLPAEGASTASFNGAAGFNIPGQGSSNSPGIVSPPASAPADESYKNEFLKGGPGALVGQGRDDWSGSDALIGSGMALMAMSGNHQGAAALAQLLTKGRKKETSSPWAIKNFNPETGKGLYVNGDTGQVEERQFAKPYKTMDDTQRKMFNEFDDNIGINSSIIANSQKYQQMIADGKIDLSLAARSKDFLNSYVDASDEVGRNTQSFLQWRNGLANDLLRLNKGTQTDRDYANTLKELAPGLSNYDNRGTLTALDAITGKARDHLGRQIQRQTGVLDEYGENAPKGDYRSNYSTLLPKYEQAEQDFAEKRKSYLSRQDAASQAQESSSTPRVAPNNGSSGSFTDFMRRRQQR